MRYVIFFILELLFIILAYGKDLKPIAGWLIGINFTFAIFSINFTFFGYQLSRYKSILDRVTRRQWFNIVLLMTLPFLSLLCFLVSPTKYAHIALFLLPVIAWSAIDNALLTKDYLDPISHLGRALKSQSINSYIDSLYNEIKKEVQSHEEYLSNREKFQIPSHEWSFAADTLGLKQNDLWDKLSIVLKQSVINNDYPVFQRSLEHMISLLTYSYNLKSKQKADYRELDGIRSIAHKRFRALIHWIADEDKEGLYIESISNTLCAYLKSSEALKLPIGELTESIMSDITYLGSVMLSSKQCGEPMKVLNTIHAVIELVVHAIEEDLKNNKEKERALDQYNIARYAHLIKSLGYDAIQNDANHFVYRCMETLSYLGCNAAKIESRQTVVACLESLVQLARACRKNQIGCFWSRCIIPLHNHAEEFIGHILTWLVRDLKEDGTFTLKACAEQAYSRIRGVCYNIKPKAKSNPKFWIEEEVDGETGEKLPHKEKLHGMFGYDGEVDYSNFDDLTE